MNQELTTEVLTEEQVLLSEFQQDPVLHIETIQGCTTLLPYQKKIARSVYENERTVVSACHDVGKTFTAAKIILAFTSTFAGAKVITTAPTLKQVKMLLWSEIRNGYKNSKFPLGGEMHTTHWQISEDWFAVGFTSKTEAGSGSEGQGSASGFQGFHGEYILVVFDEATGISPSIWTQMEGLMTSGNVRFLAIGNPTTKACEFFKCFSDPAYDRIYLSCFDSPNFPANGFHSEEDLALEYQRLLEMNEEDQQQRLASYKIVNRHLLTVRWVMRMILKFGMTHPLVVSKCFGRFPDEDESVLISLGSVELAMNRTYEPREDDRVSFGVDVARFGSDKSVVTKIKGKQILFRKTYSKRDTVYLSGEITRMILDEKSRNIHVVIDATGIGSGVVDILNANKNDSTLPQCVTIHELHFGSKPYREYDSDLFKEEMEKKYVNMKSRIFIELQESLKSDLCLIEDDEYLLELPVIKYKYDSKGRWQIESKDEFRARTGRGSPDSADSLALANFGRREPDGILGSSKNRKGIKPHAPGTRGRDSW